MGVPKNGYSKHSKMEEMMRREVKEGNKMPGPNSVKLWDRLPTTTEFERGVFVMRDSSRAHPRCEYGVWFRKAHDGTPELKKRTQTPTLSQRFAWELASMYQLPVSLG